MRPKARGLAQQGDSPGWLKESDQTQAGVILYAYLHVQYLTGCPDRSCTAKTKCRKFETNIPRKGISGPQSQFPHSCVCERIIYSHDGSAFSAEGNMWTDPGNI